MKTKQALVTILLIIGITHSSQAQFWKKLKKKAEEKVEREAERRAQKRVDKKIDKTFDDAEKELDGKNKTEKSDNGNTTDEQKSNKMIDGMLSDMMNGKDVKTESSYTFNITATMQVTDFSKSKEETMQMIQGYGKKAIFTEVENPKNLIINDFKNEAAIIINQSKKTAQVMSLSFMKKMMKESPEEENDNVKMTKTGLTKTINGYLCHQYIITDKDMKIDAWFAPEVDFDYQDYLSGFNKMFGQKKSNTSSLLYQGQGYVMAMAAFENDKKVSEMKITALSKIPKTIKMSDYKVQNMFKQ
jgi:hypothetical protein